MRYCTLCGSKAKLTIPEDDDRERLVCTNCGHIHYDNPNIVVGCIPEWEGKILLAKRSIEPMAGKWTLPAGYLENGETVSEGARREVTEEVNAELGELIPFALYNLPQINQIYFMFRADMVTRRFAAGDESLDVKLFDENDVPWDDMSFKVIIKSLEQYFIARRNGDFKFFLDNIYFDKMLKDIPQ